MELKDYIKKQINEHISFRNSLEDTLVNGYKNPKTGKKITFSEKHHLENKDLELRAKRIEKKVNKQ